MDTRRITIKKYGNRRLYDITNSRYVNLDEVAQMVREGHDVQVVDATTEEDLTRAVLTQIIVEQAKADDSAFPLDILRQMIAASGTATSGAALKYLKTVFDMYQNAYSTVVPPMPGAPAAPPWPGRADRTAGPPESAGDASELPALRQRVDELESLVRGLKTKTTKRKAARKRR